MERIGERLIEASSSQAVARDLRRRLLVWRQRHCERLKLFERLERIARRRFGHDALPTEDLPLPVRLAALEQMLENHLR